MNSALRTRLAEKMAGEITLSDSPGDALRKWRINFNITPGVLAEKLGFSPSVISDYEGGRRKSPGTAVVGKIVETILSIDEENGGRYMNKYANILYSNFDDEVIYDMHDYDTPLALKKFCDKLGCKLVNGSMDCQIYGYTVVNSLNAIVSLSAAEFNKIYGWSTERALIFTNVLRILKLKLLTCEQLAHRDLCFLIVMFPTWSDTPIAEEIMQMRCSILSSSAFFTNLPKSATDA